MSLFLDPKTEAENKNEEKKPNLDIPISAEPVLSPQARKSILLSALTPAKTLKKSPAKASSSKTDSFEPVKDRHVKDSYEPTKDRQVVEQSQVLNKAAPTQEKVDDPEVSSSSSEVHLDPMERSRLEFVKDYLSRVALAQVIAKQMFSRDMPEQQQPQMLQPSPVATMESILEARWSLLSRAQLQQQQQQALLQQQLVTPVQPPKVSTIEDLTRDIISANLPSRSAVQAPITLPSKLLPSQTETRKNELLASLAFLQPLQPAKLVAETSRNPFMSFDKPPSILNNTHLPQASPIADIPPSSKVSLRMFRKTPGSKVVQEEAEDLSSSARKPDQELNRPAQTKDLDKSSVTTEKLKPGASLLKSPELRIGNQKVLENGNIDHSAKKKARSGIEKSRKSLQQDDLGEPSKSIQQNSQSDSKVELSLEKPLEENGLQSLSETYPEQPLDLKSSSNLSSGQNEVADFTKPVKARAGRSPRKSHLKPVEGEKPYPDVSEVVAEAELEIEKPVKRGRPRKSSIPTAPLRASFEQSKNDTESMSINTELSIKENESMSINTKLSTKENESISINTELSTKENESMSINTELLTKENESMSTKENEPSLTSTELSTKEDESTSTTSKLSTKETVLTSKGVIPETKVTKNGFDFEEEEEEEEVSLSAQRKANKKARLSGNLKVEGEKCNTNIEKIEPEVTLQETPTFKKKGRPRKSVSQLSEAEPETAIRETSQIEEDLPVQKKKQGRPRKLEEVKIEIKLSSEADVLESPPQPQTKLNRPRKSSIIIQPEILLTMENNEETPVVETSSDNVKVEERSVEAIETSENIEHGRKVSPAKKRLGRPKKRNVEESLEVSESESKPPEPESIPVESLPVMVPVDSLFAEPSDSEENVPLKSRKRKMSGKKSKADIIQTGPIPETSNETHQDLEDNESKTVNMNSSSKKRGRPKKVKTKVSSEVLDERSSIKGVPYLNDHEAQVEPSEDVHINENVVASKADKKDDDIFDFKTDEDEDDDNWLSQDNKSFRLKLQQKLNHPPRQRSSSFTVSSSRSATLPPSKRERFFSEDTNDVSEQVTSYFSDENASHNQDLSHPQVGNNNEEVKEKNDEKSDTNEPPRGGMKRRRSSFANSFYSQAPRRKVLRRTAARLSMQKASESEALMTAIFDDSSLSNELPVVQSGVVADNKAQDEVFQQREPQVEDPLVAQQDAKHVENEVKDLIVKSTSEEPAVNVEEEPIPSKTNEDSSTVAKELSIEEEFAKLSEIPDDEESFYEPWNRPKRARRPVQNPVQIDLLDSNRIVFPLEVRAFAIDRIRQGETKLQVARDLDVSVSTVSGWWNR